MPPPSPPGVSWKWLALGGLVWCSVVAGALRESPALAALVCVAVAGVAVLLVLGRAGLPNTPVPIQEASAFGFSRPGWTFGLLGLTFVGALVSASGGGSPRRPSVGSDRPNDTAPLTERSTPAAVAPIAAPVPSEPEVVRAARSLLPQSLPGYQLAETLPEPTGVTAGYHGIGPNLAVAVLRPDGPAPRSPPRHFRRISIGTHRGLRNDEGGMSFLTWRSGGWAFVMTAASDQGPGQFHVVDAYAYGIADYADRQPAISVAPSQPSEVVQPTVLVPPPGVAPAVALRQPVASAVARAPRVHAADQRATPSSEPTTATVPAAQPHSAGSRALSADEM